MAHKQRAKMPEIHRAKQFVPFAAVKGLNEALTKKETVYAKKAELSADAAQALDHDLALLSPGDKVKITCHNGSEYKSLYGEIIAVDTLKQKLILTGIDISFSDILSLSQS